MKFLREFVLTLVVIFNFYVVYGQEFKDNELVIINGQKYVIHQVKTGETIYSLSRNFKVEPAIIIKNNPGAEDGLNIGEMMKIPYDGSVDIKEISGYKKGDPTGFKNYFVESNGETAYSISKKFGVTVEEIYAYNPDVLKIKKGLTLKIPVWEFQEISSSEFKPQSAEKSKSVTEDRKIHTVVSGETLYGISRVYNVSESDILALNPDAGTLKAGAKIVIPPSKTINSESVVKPNLDNHSGNTVHQVEPGETMYGITRKYGITEADLKSANPELVSLQAGMKLIIPNFASQKEISPENVKNEAVTTQERNEEEIKSGNCKKLSLQEAQSKSYSITLFLPLFLEANADLRKSMIPEIPALTDSLPQNSELPTDSVVETNEPIVPVNRFYENSENFLQFYEGVLIALDSMQKSGMKIKLNVFDTKDSPENVRKQINSGALNKTDLVIGPVYENVQKEVASAAFERKIPIVSPFTPRSSLINNNPYFFQINPSREYLANATLEMIKKDFTGKNFIIIKTNSYEGTPDGQMVQQIQKIFTQESDKSLFKVYDFKRERARGLKNILSPDEENVVFIPTSDEGELSVAISNLNNLADEFRITLVAPSNFQQRYQSIEIAHFHNLKMHYINPYWVDYSNPQTIGFVEKFRSEFGTEPNSYGIQGFDVAYFFINNLFWYGDNFLSCLNGIDMNLVQGTYKFEKISPSGGYMNRGVSVIEYKRNFEVARENVMK